MVESFYDLDLNIDFDFIVNKCYITLFDHLFDAHKK